MSLAAVTNLGGWQVEPEEIGHTTIPRKPKEQRRIRATDNSQWSEVIEIGKLSPGIEAAMRRVVELSTMAVGWDGYRSPPVGAPAISEALNLLSKLEGLALPTPHIAPVPGGGIQIEWARANKELEIDFRRDGTMGYLKVESSGEDSEGMLTFQDPKLLSLLVWLSE
jgi:hypothetical protein